MANTNRKSTNKCI